MHKRVYGVKAEGRIAKTKIRAVPKKAARVHKEAWCVFQNAHGAFAEMLKVRLQKCSQCVCRNAHGAFAEMLMVCRKRAQTVQTDTQTVHRKTREVQP